MPKHRAIDTESNYDYDDHSDDITIYNELICKCKKCKFYDTCKRKHGVDCISCEFYGRFYDDEKNCKSHLRQKFYVENTYEDLDKIIKWEQKTTEKRKSLMAQKHFSIKKNLIPLGSQKEFNPIFPMSKYPKAKYFYRNITYPHIEDLTIRTLNLMFNRHDQISVSYGMEYFISIPNTSETRYDLVYTRILKPLFKVPDVLINIIILYLLYNDEWQNSFNWDIQLM